MRSRLMKTLEDRSKQAQFNFLTTLLPVLDNLNLAVAASETDPSVEHLRNGVVGTAYNQTLSTTGGTAPYTFALTTGALPVSVAMHAAVGDGGVRLDHGAEVRVLLVGGLRLCEDDVVACDERAVDLTGAIRGEDDA